MASSVNHSSCGMKVADEMGLLHSEFAIAGHHAGLPDGGNPIYDSAQSNTLVGRLKRPFPDASHWRDEIKLPVIQVKPQQISAFASMMRTRMHASALVDADRLDAEFFVNGEVNRDESVFLQQLLTDLGEERLKRSDMPSPPELLQSSKSIAKALSESHAETMAKLAQIMEKRAESLLARPATTDLNRKRNMILQDCMKRGCDPEWKPGLYTLTAPTGSGKTDSSLTFALEHAKTHHLDRVIYVVPYTAIIDQTVKDFETLLGPNNVLPHYADANFQVKERDELNANDLHRSFAAENWNMPVIVTTAVQFFESLFSNKPSKLRKIHNIARSVIIFDEAQTLPISYLRPCVQVITELIVHYHVCAVLCTATQPALQDLFSKAFEQSDLVIPEIAPLTNDERSQFQRNRIVVDGHVSLDQLVSEIESYDQVLCVVNTRKEAQYVSQAIQRDCADVGNFCLTTLQCAHDRDELFRQIRVRLSRGETCRVISTSLIEAGVDVDFPVAYREETGLDSILQTAGRCNREGSKDPDLSLVHVFSTDEGKVSFLSQNVVAFELTKKKIDDLASSEAVHMYFDFLLNQVGDDALDIEKILEAHKKGISGCIKPFAVIATKFKLINTATVPVYIPLNDESRMLCQRLMDPKQYCRKLFRELGQYAVNVWPKQLAALQDAGKVIPLINGDNIEDTGAFVLSDLAAYNMHVGLRVSDDQLPQEGLFF